MARRLSEVNANQDKYEFDLRARPCGLCILIVAQTRGFLAVSAGALEITTFSKAPQKSSDFTFTFTFHL